MGTKKGFLIATSAGFAAAAAMPGAQAADMPIKAPRYVEQAASWAGWYVGANVGAAWQQTQTSILNLHSASRSPRRRLSAAVSLATIGNTVILCLVLRVISRG